MPLYVVRKNRSAVYLPENYKTQKHSTVTGVSKTGEVSPKGTLIEMEGWDGDKEIIAQPTTIHMVWDKEQEKFRPKTLKELIRDGKFFIGRGPADITIARRIQLGI